MTTKEPYSNDKKLSHKKWKSLKRKQKRQAVAKQRDYLDEIEQELKEKSPNEQIRKEKEENIKKEAEEEEERERQRQYALWLAREERAQMAWKAKKQWQENEQKRREEDERKIREEWDARQKIELEEETERKRIDEEKKKKQEELLRKATENEKKSGSWHNPIAPVKYISEENRDHCSFFIKTGACRFGDSCSRFHDYPDMSRTILIPGMYTHFELEQSWRDEYDTDLALEYEDKETYQHFKEFYNDVLPEFKSSGRVIQFKVCCNYEPHLRGNVYVQFRSENEALDAFQKFNGRWYGGKQLSCVFVNIDKWKSAICGLYFANRCPKGKACNFLHIFCNPGYEFREADQDRNNDYTNQSNYKDSYRASHHSSRDESSKHCERSHSRSRHHRRSRSRDRHSSRPMRSNYSPSPPRNRKYDRSPSRSTNKSRHRRSSDSPTDENYRRKHKKHKYRRHAHYRTKDNGDVVKNSQNLSKKGEKNE